MFRFLKTLKNKGRKLLFGNRGVWNRNGTHRSSAGRTHLGRLKNKMGIALFGSRKRNGRTAFGRGKNWIEKRLGLNRSRNNMEKLREEGKQKAKIADAYWPGLDAIKQPQNTLNKYIRGSRRTRRTRR